MQLTLKPHEAALLRRILLYYLTELRGEIPETDDYDFRQNLKNDEVVLKELIARLQESGAALV